MTGQSTAGRFRLSEAHVEAVNRQRRVIQNFDVLLIDPDAYESIDALVENRFTFLDDPETCTDSVWWNWTEGNVVPYASQRLPTYNVPGYRRWLEEGVDIVGIFLEETRRRGLEVFYTHRINGGDNDPNYKEDKGAYQDDSDNVYRVPFKEEHPEWMIPRSYNKSPSLNFEFEGVRQYVLANLTEVAENFGFDGLELDFARNPPVVPPGKQWALRDCVTEFMRSMRSMTLGVEERRGRPFLLAARVPENILGCHYDGLDVEAWARDQLVDLFVMGCRNFEVDVAAFRRATQGRPIKLYCALDDHHSSDGYCAPRSRCCEASFPIGITRASTGSRPSTGNSPPIPGSFTGRCICRLIKK